MKYLAVFILSLFLILPACAEITDNELETARAWISNSFGIPGNEPFSFIYNGASSAGFLASHRVSQSKEALDSRRVKHSIQYRDAESGLEIEVDAVEYLYYPAVEWVIRFKNTGSADTPIISNIWPLDINLRGSGGTGDFRLYYAAGSAQKVSDFQPKQAIISARDSMTLEPYGGRSSGGGIVEGKDNGVLPFFNIAYPGQDGVAAGIGWTGQWSATFTRSRGSILRLNAGMEHTHLRLRPGEEIRTPSILLLFWKGPDSTRGQQNLRRLLFAEYTPRAGGVLQPAPVAAAPYGSLPFEAVTEANSKKAIENIVHHHVPVDTWWTDAGWYTGKNWADNVGNFNPDPVRFPNGLKPVADAAHAAGLRFLLWFEPERAMPGTWMYDNHYDWLIPPPPAMPEDMSYMYADGFHLVNIGNLATREWLRSKVSGMITEIGIDIYRHDFNMYPLYYWRSLDPPDRQGMTEIKYVTGLYAYLDELKRDHPDLVIDNCASGGRRIDFEMLRRGYVLTRSDYLWDPVGQQNHTYGLSQWIPVSGIGAASNDAYSTRSGLGYHAVLVFDYYSADPSYWKKTRSAVMEMNSLRDLFLGDFATLTPTSSDGSACVAWEFYRQDLGRGLVQAFRRQGCTQESMTVRLTGLVESGEYLLTDQDGGTPQRMSGTQLMRDGLTIPFSAADKTAAKVIAFTLH